MEPSHPGALLRETIIPALDTSIKDLAAHLGVSRVALSELVNEKRGVSVEMARRLGQAFGNGARFWLALQMQSMRGALHGQPLVRQAGSSRMPLARAGVRFEGSSRPAGPRVSRTHPALQSRARRLGGD